MRVAEPENVGRGWRADRPCAPFRFLPGPPIIGGEAGSTFLTKTAPFGGRQPEIIRTNDPQSRYQAGDFARTNWSPSWPGWNPILTNLVGAWALVGYLDVPVIDFLMSF